ncbi:Ankyrin repeat domain containing protein [Pandoravirus neocaledonia]|uniref:Ankyrin repeat domain containing protein n=1 Tax=Pandoravirus neocaledonia TaxID=2107708 RepID=A0A2U7UCB6_9VIRU|nr:Ankyrin repeat domain containing protein [Pandoravirus neocaledonia]AVK76108.1 Ankyrin repeat domain containing protein [Pandoravirus neocaledonia]
MEPRDHETAINHLPAEIVCLIVGSLSGKDHRSARLAHRCFAVRESARTLDRRRRDRWLRVSPERACAAGRIDVMTFLYDRNRVPRTLDLTDAAVKSGDVDMMRLVRQRSGLWSDPYAALVAAKHGRTNLFHYLLGVGVPDVATIIPDALCSAASHGHLDTTMSLARIATTDDRRQALKVASYNDHAQIVRFLLDRDSDLRAQDALYNAMGSPGVMRLILERGADLDVRSLLDGRRRPSWLPLTAEVAQLLYDRCPGHSLQHLLEHACCTGVAQFACDTDPAIDIQQALEKAAARHNFDMVRFLYAKKRDMDLGPAIEYAAAQGSAEAVAVLCHLDPSADLLQGALSAVQEPDAACTIRNACSTIETAPARD